MPISTTIRCTGIDGRRIRYGCPPAPPRVRLLTRYRHARTPPPPGGGGGAPKAREGWGCRQKRMGIPTKAQVGWRCRQRAYGYPPKVQAGWGRPARYPGIRLRRPAGAGSTRSTGLGGERQRGGDRPDLHPTWRPHAGSPRAVKEGRGSVPVCVLEQFLVPQDIALNLSGYGLWEFRDKLDRSRVFVRGGGVPDVSLDLPDQRLGWLVTGL